MDLNTIPASETGRPEPQRMSYLEILEAVYDGKLLLTAEPEARLYSAFGLNKPKDPFYPVLTWKNRDEALAQQIFSTHEQGEVVECHYVGQEICSQLGLGNPGAGLSGRGFRGHAYSGALREYLLAKKVEVK